MSTYQNVQNSLRRNPKTWLVTGVAGFIGSNLLESLLGLGQRVIGLDNLSTGYQHNLDQVQSLVGEQTWQNFTFYSMDIRNLDDCREAVKGVDYVLHQAALGSVPRSIDDPLLTNACNVDGFLNMLVASAEAGVQRFVYAASSATYGDHAGLPKVEDKIGRPLSPYAVSKYVNELYAQVFSSTHGLASIGLRYFNVFGPRQDPLGGYAAVIPRWLGSLLNGQDCKIFGDGETSRDFCFVRNAVQANILSATTINPAAINQVYNVAVGERTTLNQLFYSIRDQLSQDVEGVSEYQPGYESFRDGDIRHSLADITKASELLGYSPRYSLQKGLVETCRWYFDQEMLTDNTSLLAVNKIVQQTIQQSRQPLS